MLGLLFLWLKVILNFSVLIVHQIFQDNTGPLEVDVVPKRRNNVADVDSTFKQRPWHSGHKWFDAMLCGIHQSEKNKQRKITENRTRG